jgi:pimeloyl-ACP methyl ester carboxylesterase
LSARCGTFNVPEKRGSAGGRMLPLKVVILPARQPSGLAPVFMLSGGPGQAATEGARWIASSWRRDKHDLVLMDLRGTGAGHRLNCEIGGNDENLQSYLEPAFRDGKRYAECRRELERAADLTRYTTPISMQDLDELRQALGYEKINLEGTSYGTRAGLTYIRMFGKHVHAAFLNGVAAIENAAPLNHAAAAKRAFEELVKQCTGEAACKAAFPDPAGDLRTVLQRLQAAPAEVTVQHPVSRAPVKLLLSDSALGDALRVMLYSAEGGRRVPLLLQRAKAGDLSAFAEAALQSSRGQRRSLATGLLLSVSCSEDVWRIREDQVAPAVAGSFIGPYRLRGQMEACSVWPRGDVPASYYQPFKSQVPTLIVSGHLDPVTPPKWGEILRNYLPNSIHIILPGAHGDSGPCTERLARRLFESGSIEGLDPSCVSEVRNPPFVLPGGAAAAG